MVWAELARDKLKGKKIAVVHDKTTYGKGLADAALDNMHKFGVKEVLYEGVNTGEKDYSAIVSKIKEFGRRLSDVGRPAHRRRPHHPPDARPGHEDDHDLRRRHHR